MTQPTDVELRVFALVLTHGQQGAAQRRGTTVNTVHQQLRRLYRRLGVAGTGPGGQTAFAAARALGWLSVPDFEAPRRDVSMPRQHRDGCVCSVCFVRAREAVAESRRRAS